MWDFYFFLSWLALSSSQSLTDLDIHIDRSIYIHTTVVLIIKALKINLLSDYFFTFIDLLTANKWGVFTFYFSSFLQVALFKVSCTGQRRGGCRIYKDFFVGVFLCIPFTIHPVPLCHNIHMIHTYPRTMFIISGCIFFKAGQKKKKELSLAPVFGVCLNYT